MATEEATPMTLATWYAGLTALTVDIISDFSGRELFVVHGDALIRHVLSQQSVDVKDGLQLLHVVYEVEKFLSDLSRRSCNYHVVFFKVFSDICILPSSISESSKIRLVHVAVVEHLTRWLFFKPAPGVKPIPVYQFDDANCEEFRTYLDGHAVNLFLCDDGRRSEDANEQHCIWLQGLLYNLMSRGYHVGFINELRVENAKVMVPLVRGAGVDMPSVEISEPSPLPKNEEIPASNQHCLQELIEGSLAGGASGATLRDAVSIKALHEYAQGRDWTSHMTYAFALILHNAVLKICSLSERLFRRNDSDIHAADEQFFQDFCSSATAYVKGSSSLVLPDAMPWDISDLIDGRVFFTILGGLKVQKPLPILIEAEATRHFDVFIPMTQLPLARKLWANIKFTATSSVTPPISTLASTPTVLEFRHPIFAEYLRDIKLKEVKDMPNSAGSITFEELTHWHNRKPLEPRGKIVPANFWAQKRKQRLANEIVMYAASLTGSQGKSITRETVIVIKQPAKKVKKITVRKQANTDTAKPTPAALSDINPWKQLCVKLMQEPDLAARFLEAQKFLFRVLQKDASTITTEVYLYLCNILALLWAKDLPRVHARCALGHVGQIWHLMLQASKLPFSTTEVTEGFKSLAVNRLGLPPFVMAGSSVSRPLAFSIATAAVPRLPLDSTEFQLEFCGPYLERSFNSCPDRRVTFEPDEWQREVLDAIDDDKSLLVVAPTSAGKTFISFYAMKKILQSNDDDILVYVAPTKALVNQIAAEVEARFSKQYQHVGKCLWAVKTRDYTINIPQKCQIMITVPSILQIMLMSPANAERSNSWSYRIKRIIFDEVHCIGQAEDGIIWEQLLLLAPCPIIALSATVGNIGDLRDWLTSIQRRRGHQLDLIVHSVRYSDLRKFIYHPPPSNSPEFGGLLRIQKLAVPGLDDGAEPNGRFVHVHPVAAIIDPTRSDLNDLTLEPRDAVVLWRLLKEAQTPDFPLDEALDPRTCHASIVTKSQFTSWEEKLKTALHSWMTQIGSPFNAIQSKLRTDSPHHVPSGKRTKETLDASLFSLLGDLHEQDSLPALIFSFDRAKCESALLGVCKRLQEAEERYKKGPQWQAKLSQYTQWQKSSAAIAKKAKGTAVKGRPEAGADKTSKLERQRDEGSAEDHSKWTSFDPDAPLEQFSFADFKKLTDSECDQVRADLKYADVRDEWIDALRRGLGVHHSGMNRRYRQMVEMLFRKKYLRVVIATGTLALGINMPCKTVVFHGDSVFLTALMYRQASGRAGRRGFDLLGNVVFNGITTGRVYDIVSSQLPDLNGQFSVSTSLLLRIFILLHGTKSSRFAVDSIQALLGQTRLYLGGPEAEISIKHHVRFSIEYLRRQHLLSATGVPINFAGLITHLYYAENGTFAWHALLTSGYFYELCADIESRPRAVLLELMLVLSHLFQRQPISQRNSSSIRAETLRSPSVVFLPRLPARAEKVLVQHNRQLLDIFRGYVHSFVAHNLPDADRTLPLSRMTVGPARSSGVDAFGTLRPAPVIRSPFVALSGHDDRFETVGELCRTVRSGVFLEESALPYIPIWPLDVANPLNAYLYDFFQHGSLEVLVRDNRIKRGDVWFRLQDFALTLQTIVTSLANFLSASDGGGDDTDGDYENDDDTADGSAPRAAAAATRPVEQTHAPPAKTPRARKKETVDAWDASSDDESDSGSATQSSPSTAATSAATASPLRLERVLKAFEMLKEEWDVTFRKVWA